MRITKYKIARLAENKKQMELALEAGIPTSVLSQIENGWLNPNPHQVEKLERVLPKLRMAETLIG